MLLIYHTDKGIIAELLKGDSIIVEIGIANAQYRAFLLMEGGNPFQRMIVERQHLLGIVQKLKAHRRQADGTRGSVEEFGVEFRFQTLDLAGYRRLR